MLWFLCRRLLERLACRIRDVRDFSDVFQSLEELPLSRSEPFTIELEPGTAPMSRALYRMGLAEMAELKKQLEELLSRVYPP